MLFAAVSALALAATTPQNHVAKAASLELWARHAKEQKLAAIETKDRAIASAADMMAMGSGDPPSGFDDHGTYTYTGSYKDLMKVCGLCTSKMEAAETAYYKAVEAHKDAEAAMSKNFTAAEAMHIAGQKAAKAYGKFVTTQHDLVADFKLGTEIVSSFAIDSDAVAIGKKLDALTLCDKYGPLVEAQTASAEAHAAADHAVDVFKEADKVATKASALAEKAEAAATVAHTTAKEACGQMKKAEMRIKYLNDASMEMETEMATTVA